MIAGRFRQLLQVALLIASITACSGDDTTMPDGGGMDAPAAADRRGEALTNLGTNVILPTYRELAVDLAALVASADAYATAPSVDTRAAAQAAWVEAMDVLERAEMMQLGPYAAMDLAMGGADLRDGVYAWPALNLCVIDQATAGPEHADPAALAMETVNARGLGAIEYLLFIETTANNCSPLSPINTDGTWASFTPEEIEARRARQAHSLAVIAEMVASDLVARWEGGFLAELTDPARAGALYGSAQEGLNAVSDAMFYLDKETKDLKVADPAGLSTACMTTPTCPERVESRFADRSKEHIIANLRGYQALYLGGPPGADGVGFDDLLRDLGAASVADTIALHIADAIVAAEAIEGTLTEALASDLDGVVAAHAAQRVVTDDLKTMMITLLDLEIPVRAAGDTD